MRKLKNLFLVGVLACLMVGVTNVNAMSKDELEAKLTKTYEINGVSVGADSSAKVEIERYLQQNDVSEKDCDYIAGKFDEALAIIENGNATKFDELTKSEKDQIKALIAEVSQNTEVKVTVLKGGKVIVYNLDGTKFSEITKSDIKYNTDVKYTNDENVVLLAGAVSIIGLFVIARKIKKANA